MFCWAMHPLAQLIPVTMALYEGYGNTIAVTGFSGSVSADVMTVAMCLVDREYHTCLWTFQLLSGMWRLKVAAEGSLPTDSQFSWC